MYKAVKKVKIKVDWYRVKFHSNPQVRKLTKAIGFIKNDHIWQQEEIFLFNTIAELRQQYSNSGKSILVQDYGAGSSKSPRTIGEMEKGVISEKRLSDIYKVTSSPEKWGELIFKMVREVKPKKILELGTSLGISAAYQISALKLNQTGEFLSIEGSPEVAKVAAHNLEKIGYDSFSIKPGKFKDVLPEVLPQVGKVDMVFIDGHHDNEATKEYFELLYPYLSENSVLIFDDINWSSGMKQVWKEIYRDKRINVSFDLYKWGICQIDKNKTNGKLEYFKLDL